MYIKYNIGTGGTGNTKTVSLSSKRLNWNSAYSKTPKTTNLVSLSAANFYLISGMICLQTMARQIRNRLSLIQKRQTRDIKLS